MPANVEIKAKIGNPSRLKSLVEALACTPSELTVQEDTFFTVNRGRLKLRKFSSDSAELIYYEREDGPGPKESRYTISRTSQPDSLIALLQRALGVRGVVRKTRILYVVGQTRIHLDEVEGLGAFVELEVVMQPGQSQIEGVQIARELMAKLEIQDTELVDHAYIDLLPTNKVR
jgi:predicted adenylyl cyclase CyaB